VQLGGSCSDAPVNPRKIVDLPFSKTGRNLRKGYITFGKVSEAALDLPQGLTSCVFGTPYSDEISGIGTKDDLDCVACNVAGLRKPISAS